MSWDLRLGRWQDALADVTCDALIFDAPYSETTHKGSKTTRADGCDTDGLSPEYAYLTPDDVHAFVRSWTDRCRGWIVSITDDVLAPIWKAAYREAGRLAFPAVPCVMRGMTCRIRGDGPSSWAVYAMVSRPRSETFAEWGTLPGAYSGPPGQEASGGRGKPDWLPSALVRDYSRPGDVVCDPFAGWGSTLKAAESNGRRAVGAEMDPDAYARAMTALARPLQIDMFGAAPAAESRGEG